MPDNNSNNISWDLISKVIVILFLLLQLINWIILPRFIDIYYHLLTAWGFIQAGGYSGWDFWQYAPVGRPHIYPPLFHLILAGLIKAGISPVILAKLCEALIPAAFLALLWKFIKDNYNSQLAFFVVLSFFSSFSFYLSLLNHIPATLAFIFGILALAQLFKKNILRSSILLALCFYAHIGLSWFFAFTFLIYGFLNKEKRGCAFKVSCAAFILALPVIIKELNTLKFITASGFDLHEKNLCQIKITETILAFIGLFQALRAGKEYKLFAALLFASLIFLSYPYRFFSAEGYFPVALLAALCLYNICQRLNRLYPVIFISVFVLAVSPTLSMHKAIKDEAAAYQVKLPDAGFLNILLAKGDVLWFPDEYNWAAKIAKDNSQTKDIVYCTLNSLGLAISSLAGRSSANALLPEIGAPKGYNPFASAKIIVFTRLDDGKIMDLAASSLNLIKIGESKFFLVYKNPHPTPQMKAIRASVPFWLVFLLGFGLLALFIVRRGSAPF